MLRSCWTGRLNTADLHNLCSLVLLICILCRPNTANLHILGRPNTANLHNSCRPNTANLHNLCRPYTANLYILCRPKHAHNFCNPTDVYRISSLWKIPTAASSVMATAWSANLLIGHLAQCRVYQVSVHLVFISKWKSREWWAWLEKKETRS